MPIKRSKLLETQLAFGKKELRRSKLFEKKTINFSRFTLGTVWENLSQLRLHLFCANQETIVNPFCELSVK